MNKCFISILLFFYSVGSFAQNNSKLSYKWRKPDKFVEIPGIFKDEDAVAIYNYTGVKNSFDVTSTIDLYSSYYHKARIRILTANGLKDYTNISIRKYRSYNTSTLDVRTIKKDGKTIPIKPEDIKLLKTYDESEDIYYYEYKIAVPGVEVGDDIEYIYTAYSKGLSLAADVYLCREIACLESSFELTLKRGIITNAFAINNMVPQVLTEDLETQTLSWTMHILPPVKNQYYAIRDLEFPYIQYKTTKIALQQYNIDEDMSIANWGELNNFYDRLEYDNYNKSIGLEKYFNSFKGVLDTMKATDKVRFFVNKINDEFTLLDESDEENKVRPVSYFVENKKMDFPNLRLFYKYMFYYLSIPYETCYGKNRYDGELYTEIISKHQITDAFFTFMDEQQVRHFLFRSFSDTKFYVDELPFSLESTRAIYLKKQDPFTKDNPAVQISQMPCYPRDNNVRSITCAFTIQPDWASTLCDIKVSYTGHLSSKFRTSWIERAKDYKKDRWIDYLGQKEIKTFELDTVYVEQKETNPPFKFNARVKSKETDVISAAGDNISSLKVMCPFGHYIIETYSYRRTTDLYTPFLYSDELVYFVKFPAGVTIINEKDLTKSTVNEAGGFALNIARIDDSTYKITSVYRINSKKIIKANYSKLVELNDLVEQTKELNILYKKL